MVGKSKNPKESSMTEKGDTIKRSPGRPKSPGRRSPARTSPSKAGKSSTIKARVATPTRTSTRARSPARIPNLSSPPTPKPPAPVATRKSPSRSPARTVKDTGTNELDKASLRSRKQKIIIDTDTDSDNPESLPEVKEKPKATVRGRSRINKSEISTDKIDVESFRGTEFNALNVMRRFTRSSQNREVEKVVHLKHCDPLLVTKRLGEFSDEDAPVLKKEQPNLNERKLNSFNEFGGVYGASVLLFLLPLSAISLYLTCDEKQCSFTKMPDFEKYLNLASFLDGISILAVLNYDIVMAVYSVVPIGGRKVSSMPSKDGKIVYVMNGLFVCLNLIVMAAVLEFNGVGVADYIVKHVFHLLMASVLRSLVISVVVYVKSFYVPVSSLNVHAAGKGSLYSFFLGREVNPRIHSVLNLKLMYFRGAVCAAVLLILAHFYKFTGMELSTFDVAAFKINFSPTLTALVFLQLFYLFDALVFEKSLVCTFEMQEESFGYMTAMSYALFPFLLASMCKFVSDYSIELAPWKLILSGSVFLFGYVLYRGSNNQKNAFRLNPYSPALTYLETIPTTQGKKLLVSGFWGVIRHPNYLGNILIHLSFLPFVVGAPPALIPLSMVLCLIHRAERDHGRCKAKYGAAWDRYCAKVKFVLFPKVY